MPAASHIPELPLTYRPRAVRRWGYIVAAVFALACLVMAVSLPLLTHKVFDSLGFVLLALAVGWFATGTRASRCKPTPPA